MDREKVIKCLEMCSSPSGCSLDECPYYERQDNVTGVCWDMLMADALELLKELDR